MVCFRGHCDTCAFLIKFWVCFLNIYPIMKLRESVPRQVDRESRGPQGERGLEFSRRKK